MKVVDSVPVLRMLNEISKIDAMHLTPAITEMGAKDVSIVGIKPGPHYDINISITSLMS